MSKLYIHQQEAFEKFRDSNEIAIFFEQGCGKSATALTIADYKFFNKQIEQLLIIAPNDVHRQWAVEQIPLWTTAPNDTVCLFGRGGLKKFVTPLVSKDTLGIICVNIDTFSTPDKWKQIAEWARSRPTMIILDEATSIKNVESNRTQRILTCFNIITRSGRTVKINVKHENCQVRCVLTGTPVTNGPMDLWSIMEFVKPSFFNRNWYDFKQYYGMFTTLSISATKRKQQKRAAKGMQQIRVLLNENTWRSIKMCKDYNTAYQIFGVSQDTYFTIQSQDKYVGPYKRADELKKQLDTVAVFKKITDCIDMPEQVFITRTLTMNNEQSAAYRQMLTDQAVEYEGRITTALNKLTMATRLQQISSGFIYDKTFLADTDLDRDLLPDEVVWLGKSNPKIDALIRDIDESDKPVIVMTRYTAEADKIYSILKDQYSVMLYTGWKKTGTIDDFKEGKYDILVANTSCIAYGFNLQKSHTILYYSNTFSMELREQSQARIFRSGQKYTCKYVDYVFDNTIDTKILAALKAKKNMLEYFREHPDEEVK